MKCVPSRASRSIAGVWIAGFPAAPTQSQRWSSLMTSTILGCAFSPAKTQAEFESGAPTATSAMIARRNLLRTFRASDTGGVQRVAQHGIVDRFLDLGELRLQLVTNLSRFGLLVEVPLLAGIVLQVVQLVLEIGELEADQLPVVRA